jgi:hypothetical protein
MPGFAHILPVLISILRERTSLGKNFSNWPCLIEPQSQFHVKFWSDCLMPPCERSGVNDNQDIYPLPLQLHAAPWSKWSLSRSSFCWQLISLLLRRLLIPLTCLEFLLHVIILRSYQPYCSWFFRSTHSKRFSRARIFYSFLITLNLVWGPEFLGIASPSEIEHGRRCWRWPDRS